MPLLPSIRHLLLSNDNFDFINVTAEFAFQKTIRCIIEPDDSIVTKCLLLSDLCPSLITLSCHSWDREIIPLLRNAPAVENLNIGIGSGVSFRILEIIHDSLPNLKSLKINTYHLDGTFSALGEVTPAPLLTHFQVGYEESNFIIHEYDMIAYIYVKYPNLVHLLNLNIVQDKAQEEIGDMFRLAWTPYLNRMAPQLHTLHLRSDRILTKFLIDKIDDDRYHIPDQYFEICHQDDVDYLKQLHYISKLTLHQRVSVNYNWLPHLVSLSELKLEWFPYERQDETFMLNKYCQSLPTNSRTSQTDQY